MIIECFVTPILPIIVGKVAHVFPCEMESKPEPNPNNEKQRKFGLTRTGIVLAYDGNKITTSDTEYKIINI